MILTQLRWVQPSLLASLPLRHPPCLHHTEPSPLVFYNTCKLTQKRPSNVIKPIPTISLDSLQGCPFNKVRLVWCWGLRELLAWGFAKFHWIFPPCAVHKLKMHQYLQLLLCPFLLVLLKRSGEPGGSVQILLCSTQQFWGGSF